ncbi:hypothetical protein GXW82_10870 [Streptacidiphilus sp. 4-A2]|nr:hypothetical protein [Streptacidiphilus sp. 4-A2]
MVLLDLWRTEARAVAGDIDQAVAVTAPGPSPRTRPADPMVEEVLARFVAPAKGGGAPQGL